LPTGVDKITTKKGEIDTFLTQFGFTPDDKLILFVGRLGTEKNVELLVRSFPLVLAKVPEARLVLAGDHPKRAALQKIIDDLGIKDQCRITGYIEHEQLGALYDAADVFAFPSLTDTQGLVVNEAAAAGLPLVLTDPTINEVLIEGKSGYKAKDNPRDFAAKLTKLLANDTLRYEMGREARRQAIKYTTSKQALKLLRLYQDVIKKHREQDQPQKRKIWIRRRRDT
jgi:glycosyltransferase involved in cell wall biosynthesis